MASKCLLEEEPVHPQSHRVGIGPSRMSAQETPLTGDPKPRVTSEGSGQEDKPRPAGAGEKMWNLVPERPCSTTYSLVTSGQFFNFSEPPFSHRDIGVTTPSSLHGGVGYCHVPRTPCSSVHTLIRKYYHAPTTMCQALPVLKIHGGQTCPPPSWHAWSQMELLSLGWDEASPGGFRKLTPGSQPSDRLWD